MMTMTPRAATDAGAAGCSTQRNAMARNAPAMRQQSRKRPSDCFMMVALWTAVTRLRPLSEAYLSAKSAMRCSNSSGMQKHRGA